MCICLFFPSFSDSLVDSCIDSFIESPPNSFLHSFSQSLICSIVHTFTIIHIIHIIIHAPSAPGGHQVVTRWSPGGHQAVLAMSRSQVLNSSLALCISPVAMTVDNLACENCGKSWGSCLREEFWPFFVCQCFVVSNAFRWFGVLKLESSRSWKMRLEVDLGSDDNFSVVEMQIRVQEVLTPSWKIQPLGPCSMP